MSKTKSLLSFALAATMLFSTVFVGANAEDATPKTGTLNIGTATVEVGEPTATVDFTLTFDEAVKSPHSLCTIVSDYELTKLAVKSVDGTVVADDENLAEGDDDLVSSATVKISNNGLNLAAKKVIFESGVDSNAPVVTTIVFTATFDTSAAVAGTSAVSAAIDATNYDENTFALTVNDGEIVVAEPHEHNFVGEETTPATCTTPGVKTYTCECGKDSYTEEIPVIPHNYVDGACSVCGAADPDYVPEEPECEHVWDAGVITTMPSVTEGGVKEFTCSACGETKTEDVAAFDLSQMTVNLTYDTAAQKITGIISYTRAGCVAMATYVKNELGGEILDFGTIMTVDGQAPAIDNTTFINKRTDNAKGYSWSTMQNTGYNTSIGYAFTGMNFNQISDIIKFAGFVAVKVGDNTYYYYGQVYGESLYNYLATATDEKSVALYNACNTVASATSSITTADTFNSENYGIEFTASYDLKSAKLQLAPKFTRAGCIALADYIKTLGGTITDFGTLMTVDGTDPTYDTAFFKYARTETAKGFDWNTMQDTGYNTTLGCAFTGMNLAQFGSVVKFRTFVQYTTAEGNTEYFYPSDIQTYKFIDMIEEDNSELAVELKDLYNLFNAAS